MNVCATPEENGFNPVWNEGCEFELLNPDLALLRFCVQDEDVFGDPNFIGQATYPIPCLKTGYSAVILTNTYNEELELSALLVHISIRKTYEEDQEIYTTARSAVQSSLWGDVITINNLAISFRGIFFKLIRQETLLCCPIKNTRPLMHLTIKRRESH